MGGMRRLFGLLARREVGWGLFGGPVLWGREGALGLCLGDELDWERVGCWK